jgi:gliding motility-associated-like protein
VKHFYSLLIFCVTFLFVENVSAQLAITTGQTAQQLAEVIAGPGVTVSGATITGSPDAIGSFVTGATASGLGIASGVGLSNGNIIDAGQDEFNFASTTLGTPGSPYLDNLTGEAGGDAIILEFDFVPNADFVQFNYVFCSEEHPGFSCSTYVDPFAITIQGVTVALVETNIALVPGTTTPIQINTINNAGCGNPAFYIDNAGNPNLVYGGITTVMTASLDVICGETYHLRFLQSDGGFDQAFDTSCFIEENSLTTGNVTIETTSLGGDTAAIEGCADLEITLTLNGDPPTIDVPVSIWVGGGSTAEWGIDYDPITELNQADSTIVIPAGSNSVSFTITPIVDNITEGTETIDLVAITSTCGTIDTFHLFITEVEPLSVIVTNDTTICTGNAINSAEGVGGGGGYTYTWDNGFGEMQTILPEPTATTSYEVTVTDGCGSTPAVASVLVTVDDGPSPNAGNDISVCIGGSILMNATSDSPGSTFSWAPPTDLSDATVFNPLCTPAADIEYIVTVTRPDGCSNDDTVMVTLTPPPTSDFILPVVGCAGDPMIVDYDGNANAAAQYQWNFGSGIITNGSGIGPIAVYWPAPGIYDVELIVSWNGCISPSTVNQIEILGPPPVDAGLDISFCSGDSGPIGSAPLAGVTYSWSPTNGVADPTASQTTVQVPNFAHEIEITEYTLTASEQGCENTDKVNVVVFPIPTVEFAVPNGSCFNVNSYDFLATGNFGPNTTFGWSFGAQGFPTTSNVIQPQGVIFNTPGQQDVTIVVEDNTCISQPFTATVEVFEMPVADFSFAINDGCEPLLVGFENQSYNGNSTIYNTWDFGNSTSATQHSPSTVYEAGVYTITLDVVTAQGCADSETKSDAVEVYEKPIAFFSMSSQVLDIIDPNVTVTNLAQDITGSLFTFEPFAYQVNSMTAEYEYAEVGTYEISQIVESANGCLDTIIGSLEVKPHYTLYIPNAFTPTADGINEVWVPQGESIMDFSMIIYDRWNEELFQSGSLDQGWDGFYKGKLVQQGTYTYKIDVVDTLGEPHMYFGTFSLVR